MGAENWNDIFKDWSKMPVSCYKSIFDQAKERFSEVVEESQTITKKAMQTLLIYITTLSSIGGILLSQNHQQEVVSSRALLIVASIGGMAGMLILIKLLKPKEVFYKGSAPIETFNQSAYENLTNDEFEQNFYYDEIVRYQTKIDKLDSNNRSRILLYSYVLSISMMLIGITIFLIITVLL